MATSENVCDIETEPQLIPRFLKLKRREEKSVFGNHPPELILHHSSYTIATKIFRNNLEGSL